jgi:hypothetical protein
VEFTAAAAVKGSHPQVPELDPNSTIRDGTAQPAGWAGQGMGAMASVVYTLAPQRSLAGEQVTFRLVQSSDKPGHNLGRFKLWSTTAPPPHQAESAVIVLPSHK